MATSIDELKSRLQQFLADPRADEEFRPWFATLLADPNNENSADIERLVYTIHESFSDAAKGLYTPEQLKEYLGELAKPEKRESAPAIYVVSVENGPVFFGYYENVSQSSYGRPSASGAFYSQVPANQELNAADKAQPIAWETLVVRESLAEPAR